MKTIKERIEKADKRTLALWYFDLKSKRATYMVTFEQFKQLLSNYKEDVLGLLAEKIKTIHKTINDMKRKYENRPSITRERTYLQYRKVIEILEELKSKIQR